MNTLLKQKGHCEKHTHRSEMIALAFKLAEAIQVLMEHARRFYYEVMISGHTCPRCGGRPKMIGESRCRCEACGSIFDPTIAYQRCLACGGKPRLRICRYQCQSCGRDIPSRFLFDGRAFDPEYFREAMAKSREKKKETREKYRTLAVEYRSEPLEPPGVDLESIPGLAEALNGLSMAPEIAAFLPLYKGFDLKRYEEHILANLKGYETAFDDIPPLEPDPRLDRIGRFVALIFLAHAGLIEIEQYHNLIILTRKNETDLEG